MVKSISRILLLLFIFTSTLFLTCSKDSTGPKEEGTLINATDGGLVISPDGLLTLTIPAGALDNNTYINIKEIDKEDYPSEMDGVEAIGTVYDLKPDGLELNRPAVLDIEMPQDEVEGIIEDGWFPSIGCFSISNNGTIEEIDSSSVEYDIINHTGIYKGQINHFSVYFKEKVIWTRLGEKVGTVMTKVDFGPEASGKGIPNYVYTTVKNNCSDKVRAVALPNDQEGGCIDWAESDESYIVEPGSIRNINIDPWICNEIEGKELLKFELFLWVNVPYEHAKFRRVDFYQECECVGFDPRDTDGDGIINADDACEGYDDNLDQDSDTIPDDCDNCKEKSNKDQNDMDQDTVGDACDNCPELYNPDQDDVDNDLVGSICDVCPDVYDDQTNTDELGLGDACNDSYDKDGDEFEDENDNCPDIPNPLQLDFDLDGIGNVCDTNACDIPNTQHVMNFFWYMFDIFPCDNAKTLPEPVQLQGIGPNSNLIIPDYSHWSIPSAYVTITLDVTTENINRLNSTFLFDENGFYNGDIPTFKTLNQITDIPTGEYTFLVIVNRGENFLNSETIWDSKLFINTTGEFNGGYVPPAGYENHPGANAQYWFTTKYNPYYPSGPWDNKCLDVSSGSFDEIFPGIFKFSYGNVLIFMIPKYLLGDNNYFRYMTDYIGNDTVARYYTTDWLTIFQ